jgi:hypothetical protein
VQCVTRCTTDWVCPDLGWQRYSSGVSKVTGAEVCDAIWLPWRESICDHRRPVCERHPVVASGCDDAFADITQPVLNLLRLLHERQAPSIRKLLQCIVSSYNDFQQLCNWQKCQQQDDLPKQLEDAGP